MKIYSKFSQIWYPNTPELINKSSEAITSAAGKPQTRDQKLRRAVHCEAGKLSTGKREQKPDEVL